MRNEFRNPSNLSCRTPLLVFFVFLFFANVLFAQRVKVYQSGAKTTIETFLTINDPIPANNDPFPMEPQNGENAFGFFYRIDSDPTNKADIVTGNEGSYYWKDDLPAGKNSITKTIDLPPGKYSLVAYQSRKSKPIRSIIQDKLVDPIIFEVPMPVGGATSTTFESVDMNMGGVVSNIKLENSWNVFTDPASVSNPVDHKTFNSSPNQPANKPWLIITLSLQNWQRDIILTYEDKIFTYDGAIFGNKKDDFSASLPVSSITTTATPEQLLIKPGTGPDNASGQTHVHLIFQLKPGAQFSSEYVKFTAMLENGTPVVLSLPVKPKPHDPNKLVVDKKTICPCAPAIELNYRVEFQNIGAAPVKDVSIILTDTKGLDMRTLTLKNSKTYKKGVAVSYSPGMMRPPVYQFKINNINLPGTNQANNPYPSVSADSTWDYIEFGVKTNACLKDNTFIRPKARVIFVGVPGYIETNIGETHILYSAGQSTDGAPMPCAPIVSKNCKNCSILVPGGIKDKRN